MQKKALYFLISFPLLFSCASMHAELGRKVDAEEAFPSLLNAIGFEKKEKDFFGYNLDGSISCRKLFSGENVESSFSISSLDSTLKIFPSSNIEEVEGYANVKFSSLKYKGDRDELGGLSPILDKLDIDLSFLSSFLDKEVNEDISSFFSEAYLKEDTAYIDISSYSSFSSKGTPSKKAYPNISQYKGISHLIDNNDGFYHSAVEKIDSFVNENEDKIKSIATFYRNPKGQLTINFDLDAKALSSFLDDNDEVDALTRINKAFTINHLSFNLRYTDLRFVTSSLDADLVYRHYEEEEDTTPVYTTYFKADLDLSFIGESPIVYPSSFDEYN
ncbi:MAG: hypothetical protein IJ247_00635 [Bacilli bacterium]|nr:hypothetical protein [Bacilli bacterium]